MDHIYSYALQTCTTNEERDSLEKAANASMSQSWVPPAGEISIPPSIPCQQPTNEGAGPARRAIATRTLKAKQSNFNASEDVNLTKWWLAVSTDPAVNTGQRKEGFWFRVTQGYNSSRGQNPERSQKSLNSRWDHIKEQCTKFSEYMGEILRVNPSGMSEADKTTEALARFATTQPKGFALMHCWSLLKDEPKWSEDMLARTKAAERPSERLDEWDSTPGASNTIDVDAELSTPASSTGKIPLGRDATKAARKRLPPRQAPQAG